jgi:DNA-binding response OmpR family regulator
MPEKILVVDDDPDILDALVMILESKGYTITKAHNGVEAIERIVAERPDLMILDLLMPKMDGFRVFKKLQEPSWAEFSNMPILILTSVREEASRRRYELETGKELNTDDYLEKPFSPDILLKKVDSLLHKKR